jgi:hypothetical protein
MKVRQCDRAQLLKGVPLFSYCSQRELAKIAKVANELELPAGHTLIHEDEEVVYSFFVPVNGEADARRRNRRVATLGPGDCFGAHNFRPLLMTSPEIQLKLREAPAGAARTVDNLVVAFATPLARPPLPPENAVLRENAVLFLNARV